MTTTESQAELVPIDSLKHYKGNAKIHDIDTIRESLRKNQQYKPVVVRRRTREILAGNGTWEGAKLEGHTEIWVWWVDCDAATARRINLVDNRAAELGGYDEDALMALLAALPSLEGTGWSERDASRLISQLTINVGGDTEPKGLPSTPTAKRGDLWVLGDHRLLCGDSTNQQDVHELMHGQTAECLWADPPYIGPDDNSSHGDNASPNKAAHSVDGLRHLLVQSFALADAHLKKSSPLYVCHPGGANSVLFGDAFIGQKWHLRQTLIWLKESANMMWGHDYHTQNELIYEGAKPVDAEMIGYGFTRGQRKLRDNWYGNRKQSTVMEFSRPKSSLHPTAKPVGLLEQCFINSTPKGALIYDPFCGSGPSIIAAHNLRRRCYAMEIDPGYCDVIVDRWERHTGLMAEVRHA